MSSAHRTPFSALPASLWAAALSADEARVPACVVNSRSLSHTRPGALNHVAGGLGGDRLASD
jgi:hypothetical protein